MPNIKSAKKRVEVAERNKARNRAVKSSVKTAVKAVKDLLIEDKDSDKLNELVSLSSKLIDKAVSKGVYHKNTAARKKSRLLGYIKRVQEGKVDFKKLKK